MIYSIIWCFEQACWGQSVVLVNWHLNKNLMLYRWTMKDWINCPTKDFFWGGGVFCTMARGLPVPETYHNLLCKACSPGINHSSHCLCQKCFGKATGLHRFLHQLILIGIGFCSFSGAQKRKKTPISCLALIFQRFFVQLTAKWEQ